MSKTKTDAAPETVTVYPSTQGLFFDGVPAVVQQVTPEDATWMTANDVFTRELPAGYQVTEEGTLAKVPASIASAPEAPETPPA